MLGDGYHPHGKNRKAIDCMLWHLNFSSLNSANGILLVINEVERIVATDVYEEASFPAMATGRIALLGDCKLSNQLS
jgi:hypothetical protein